MVAMFETAIDYLCQEKGVRPKIVASTATIRRAKEQCAALYNRDVAQFPSPGLDADDSYFARKASIDHDNGKYGRLYVGLMSSGKTKAMMEVRSIASLMQCIPDNTNIILHSDQGWHYQHKRYQKMLVDKGIQQSMSRKYND